MPIVCIYTQSSNSANGLGRALSNFIGEETPYQLDILSGNAANIVTEQGTSLLKVESNPSRVTAENGLGDLSPQEQAELMVTALLKTTDSKNPSINMKGGSAELREAITAEAHKQGCTVNSPQTIPPAKPAIPLSAPADSSSGSKEFKSVLDGICPDGKGSGAEKKGPLEEEGTGHSLH